jgi:hypothetical protein
MSNINNLLSNHPLPNLPPRGGPTVKKSVLWLILGRSQFERWPSRQSGAFAKIAYQAILKRSALPWGKLKGGIKLNIWTNLNLLKSGL